MTIADDIAAVKALVTTSWAHGLTVLNGAIAHDSGGRRVEATDPSATSFSLIGLCAKVTAGDSARCRAMVDAIRDENLPDGFLAFDLAPGRTRGDVVSMLARVAAVARVSKGRAP